MLIQTTSEAWAVERSKVTSRRQPRIRLGWLWVALAVVVGGVLAGGWL